MKKCEYGCDNKALFLLNNGKWCCSKFYNSCQAVIDKMKTKVKCDLCGKFFGKTVISQHIKACKEYKCKYCKKKLDSKKLFCDCQCAALYNSKYGNRFKVRIKDIYSHISYCLTCGKVINGKNRKSCNRKCAAKKNYVKLLQEWLCGTFSGNTNSGNICGFIRTFLLEEVNYKCSKCGWGEINEHTGNIPVELHHIDGWWKNNKRGNLEVLCPNCHSLTSTFRKSNMGNGRGHKEKTKK